MISYNATLLQIPGKEHVIKPDSEGYYWVAAGALNAFNSAGMFYLLEESRAAFDASGDFQRRVKEGSLYAEFGHPKQNGSSVPVFMQRVRSVYEDNVCAHIAEVKLIDGGAIDQRGKPICLITMRVKPWGPRAKDLESALAASTQNVCFSIRCIAETVTKNGIITKAIREVLTFDFVLEPGIFEAKKRYSPSLESFSDAAAEGTDVTELVLTDLDVSQIRTEAETNLVLTDGVELESLKAKDNLSFVTRLESYLKPIPILPLSSHW